MARVLPFWEKALGRGSDVARQRPDAVPAANKFKDANPFPLFQATR